MSVPKGQQNEDRNKVLFIDLADKIFSAASVSTNKKLANKDRDFQRWLRENAMIVVTSCVAANEYFPSPEHPYDCRRRRELLQMASSHLAIVSYLFSFIQRNIETKIADGTYLEVGLNIDKLKGILNKLLKQLDSMLVGNNSDIEA